MRVLQILKPILLLLMAFVLASAGACAWWFAPPRRDLTEIIAAEEPRLRDIEVETVVRGSGNWWDFSGRARLGEDLWNELNSFDLTKACNLPYEAVPPGVKALTLAAPAGTEVRFAFTSAVRRARNGDERVTAGGWATGTWGGSILLGGKPLSARPQSFFTTTQPAAFLRTDAEREIFCARLR